MKNKRKSKKYMTWKNINYESQMKEISDNFINSKSDYMRSMQEMDEKMRDCVNNREEVKKNMLIEIDRLKKEGMAAEKEQEFLRKSREKLYKSTDFKKN